MARDEEHILEKYGIDTYVVIGDQIKGNKSHAWIAVDIFGWLIHIDSVSLMPGTPLMKYENLSFYESYNDYRVGTAMEGSN